MTQSRVLNLQRYNRSSRKALKLCLNSSTGPASPAPKAVAKALNWGDDNSDVVRQDSIESVEDSANNRLSSVAMNLALQFSNFEKKRML